MTGRDGIGWGECASLSVCVCVVVVDLWYADLTFFSWQHMHLVMFLIGLYFLNFFLHSMMSWHLWHNPTFGIAMMRADFLLCGL